MGISPSLAYGLSIAFGGKQSGGLTVVHALPTVCSSVHTVGPICSSSKGKQKYSPGGEIIWTFSLDRRSHPSRGVWVSGTIKKE
jgi:hypothetical protein